jgi:hypothetical protein
VRDTAFPLASYRVTTDAGEFTGYEYVRRYGRARLIGAAARSGVTQQ